MKDFLLEVLIFGIGFVLYLGLTSLVEDVLVLAGIGSEHTTYVSIGITALILIGIHCWEYLTSK